jgi:hypothetical protein
MSAAKTHQNLDEIIANPVHRAKGGVPFILRWRMAENQDHLDRGFEQCGCGFCPDDEQRTT